MATPEDFIAQPSEEGLSNLTKVQLCAVAEHYELTLTTLEKSLKETLFKSIKSQLVLKGVLESDSDQLQFEKLKAEREARFLREKEIESERALEVRKLEHELQLKRMEMEEREHEREHALTLKKLDLELKQLPSQPPSPAHQQPGFDVTKNIRLVPPFIEKDVEKYFSHFERVATTLKWPENVWPLLLQCVFTGKAQEVFSALGLEQAMNYEDLKTAILQAYELVPEAYRQKFRKTRKSEQQTFVEFAREKERLFDRWCCSQEADSREDLRQLVLIEDFMNCLPEAVAVHLCEQEVQKLHEAAVLADKFVLTHKRVPGSGWVSHQSRTRPLVNSQQQYGGGNDAPRSSPPANASRPPYNNTEIICNYCKKVGHMKYDCVELRKRKEKDKGKSKSFGLVTSCGSTLFSLNDTLSVGPVVASKQDKCEVDADYTPFVTKGSVSLPDGHCSVPVRILRDTGAAQSFMLSGVLPLSDSTYTGTHVLVRGFEMTPVQVPLHRVCLSSKLVKGDVVVGVRQGLPVPGISFILGNDLAGGKVWGNTEAVSPPVVSDSVPEVPPKPDQCARRHPDVFPSCAVTRAMVKRGLDSDLVSLNDTFLTKPDLVSSSDSSQSPVGELETTNTNLDDSTGGGDDADGESKSVKVAPPLGVINGDSEVTILSSNELERCSLPDLFKVSREELIKEQLVDSSLKPLFVLASQEKPEDESSYFVQDGLLCRRYVFQKENFTNSFVQVVVPCKFRKAVLDLAHNEVAGHTGVRKTYDRIVRRFCWPRLRRDVSSYLKTCHVCQLTGKPNQQIPVAPLQPIPAVSNPFEYLIVDCVGPLPRSKAGHLYLLTVMCQSTRYPIAYPLRSITTKSVLKALTNFMSTFGIPKVLQSDRGSNFMSKQFARALRQLKAKHNISSAYHPQSQGALERFHQTLKSLLRSYCVELGSDWEEGLPWLLLAIREVVQESTGFSPNELVFGHAVRGPTAVLADEWCTAETPVNVLDYVSGFRYRLYEARAAARRKLGKAQSKMQRLYNRRAKQRSFKLGDKVLALLPILNSPFQAKFGGPYEIVKCFNDHNYVISTPDRRKKVQVCHINLLKPYFSPLPAAPVGLIATTQLGGSSDPDYVVSSVGNGSESLDFVSEESSEGVRGPSQAIVEGRLRNSEFLAELPLHLSHLNDMEKTDIIGLIEFFPALFPDVPTRTSVIEHDIDVGGALPIKQHAYRVNPRKKELLQKEVDYLLAHDLAEPSFSAWSSPCLLVNKPDGTFRFCTDYRRLNSVTKPDCYPLPRCDDCIDRVGSAKFVSKFDLLKGYWQVPLTVRAKELSAFVTSDNFLQYRVMPFGVRNAPATFQRLVNLVLAGMKGCDAYLDDVVLYSTNWTHHLQQINELFTRLANANLTINLAKCEFGKASVTYLGKIVGGGQVRPVGAKIEAICNFTTPENRRELRRFLGMAGYYRAFCKNFSSVVTPLTNLLSPKVQFQWSPSCQEAFDNVKLLLASSPVLSAPDFDRPFSVAVDASESGAGAVLLQVGLDGVEHPVAYFSRKFNRHQQVYSTVEREALALILAVQHFEVYLGSSPSPIDLFTDHNPLVFIDRMRNQNQRIMRWSLILQQYPLKIQHIRGKDNIVADALSRV